MKRSHVVVLLAQFLALWPTWAWFGDRVIVGADAAIGLAPFGLAIALLLRKEAAVCESSLTFSAGATAVSAGLRLLAPPSIAGAAAFAALASCLAAIRGSRLRAGHLGLLALATPVTPQLDFYLGYPLRLVSATLASAMLRCTGLDVARDGTCFAWNGRFVAVDAPCSGVRMLWTALVVACALAAARRFGAVKSAALVAVGVAATVAANAVRAAVLFLPEAGIVHAPAWAHEAVGLELFALAAVAIVFVGLRLSRGRSCAA